MNPDSIGQHYLIDKDIIKFIVDSSNLNKKDVALEIGYGHGELTKQLVKKCKVVAIDIDGKIDFKDENLVIVKGNILNKFYALKDKHEFNKIIANIPYNISEPLFRLLFKVDFEMAVMTIGENFSQLLFSKDNRIGIIANELFGMEILMDVPKKAFYPAPRVDSKIITITPKRNIRENVYRRLIRLDAKKIRNALEEIYGKKKVKAIEELKNEMYNKKIYQISNEEFMELDEMVRNGLENNI